MEKAKAAKYPNGKMCKKCMTTKPASNFKKGGWVCGACDYRKRRSKRLQHFKDYRKRHPKTAFKHRLKKWGLDLDTYYAMLASQGNRCAICRTTAPKGPQSRDQNFAVDHDHITGKIRGLLCSNCNLVLGHARDHAEVLEAAIAYLKKHQTQKS
jgi:hypothetical protein